MSDTPRTDAETYVWERGAENPFVHKEFAKQLERELRASLENQVKTMQRLVWTAGLLVRAVEIATLSVSDVRFSRRLGKSRLNTLIKEIQ